MNSESTEAKRWFAMNAQEAMEEIDAVIGKPAKKAKKGIVDFSSSAEVDVSTSPSASTDDDESILETEQLVEFQNNLVIYYSAIIISLFPIYM